MGGQFQNVTHFTLTLITLNIISVNCFEWYLYVDPENCMDMALLNNRWIDLEELDGMDPAAKKSLLMLEINRQLNGKFHSFPELSARQQAAPQGTPFVHHLKYFEKNTPLSLNKISAISMFLGTIYVC